MTNTIPKHLKPPALLFYSDGMHPQAGFQVAPEGMYRVTDFRAPRPGETFWCQFGYPMRGFDQVPLDVTTPEPRAILELVND